MTDDDSPCDGAGGGSPDECVRDGDATDTLNDVFEALSHPRRRFLLYHLSTGCSKVAERSELVQAVRDYEAAVDDGDAEPSEEAVSSDLHHGHLPHLKDSGFIEYDRRQGTVRYVERPGVDEWLERARGKEFDCAT